MEIIVYLVIGLSFSFLILGFIVLGEGKVLWKRNELLFVLPAGIITVTIGWLPIILLVLCIVGVLWWRFSYKKY